MTKTKHNRKTKHSKHICTKCRKTQKFIKSSGIALIEMAAIKIKREALYAAVKKIGSRPAESGGIFLGPAGTNVITHFYFDRGGSCTGTSYTPDHMTLRKKMQEEWLPAGLDMKGFVHSHPGSLDSLTSGDMSYIKRLLNKNTDMDMFIAPIILPSRNAIRPWVVTRDQMNYAQRAYFELF